jgi:hypothetical protein
MATSFIFGGKKVDKPGVFGTVESGVNNPRLELDSGTVLIIDKDPLSVHGNGAGIAGEATTGKDSFYTFTSITQFQKWIGGGQWYDMAVPLFRPFGSKINGASNIVYTRALTTVAATAVLAIASNPTLEFGLLNEGISGNGVEGATDLLTKGYAITLTAGVNDPAKFIMKFWRGSFVGNDSNGNSYNNIAEVDTSPTLIAQSSEEDTVEGMLLWAVNDIDFVNNFTIVTGAAFTGAIVAGDLTTLLGNNLFSGGTSAYDTAQVTAALTAIKDVNINFILMEDQAGNATSVDANKIAAYLDTEMNDPAMYVIGGGATSGTFASQSVAAATAHNSQNVVVVHGGCYVSNPGDLVNPLRLKDALYKAALVTGRLAGLDPQTPPTFKGISISGEAHSLTDQEVSIGLDAGVLMTKYAPELEFFSIVQGVNTVQLNTFVVNSDGSTHQISLVRIMRELLAGMKKQAILDLLGNQVSGPNRNTIDSETVRVWVVNYLKDVEATNTVDNLIISSSDVTVEIDSDAYKIQFGINPNYEVNKIFLTARILDDTSGLS